MSAARSLRPILLAAGLFLVCAVVPAAGQQATVSTPMHTASDSFFESTNLHWGLNGNGWFFRFGGQAVPPYGGYDPAAGASFGWGFGNRHFNGYFYGNLSQGHRSSLVSQAPSVTLSNGVPGYVSDTSQSPFVIGMIPVVGGFPTVGVVSPAMPPAALAPSPLANPAVADALRRAQAKHDAAHGRIDARLGPKLDAVEQRIDGQVGPKLSGAQERLANKPNVKAAVNDDLVLIGPGAGEEAGAPANGDPAGKLASAGASSASRPAPSVEEARRLHQKEQSETNQEVALYLERARHAEATGKSNVARQYYQMAYRRASGVQKDEIRAKLLALPAPAQKGN